MRRNNLSVPSKAPLQEVLVNSNTRTTLTYQKRKIPVFPKSVSQLKVAVTRFFTDTDGQIIDKNILPTGLQTSLPYFVFSTFDRKGAYRQSLKQINLRQWTFLKSSVVGDENTINYFTGLNNIQEIYENGDQVLIFVDDIISPSYYAYVVMSADSVALNSFTEYLPDLRMNGFLYTSDNLDNYYEVISAIELDIFGNPKNDYYTPSNNLSPMNPNATSNVLIPLKFNLSIYTGLVGTFSFETESVTISLKLQTIVKPI